MASLAKDRALRMIASAARHGGLVAHARRLSVAKCVILAYHSISPISDSEPSCLDIAGMRITPSAFRAQMEYIARHYNVISLEEALRSWSSRSPLPPRSCVITLDDGYLDAYEHAVPILENLGMKATFFIIGKVLKSHESPWLHRMHFLLDSVGLYRFHAALRQLAPDFFTSTVPSKSLLSAHIWHLFTSKDMHFRRELLERLNALLGVESATGYPFMQSGQVVALRQRGFEIGCHSYEHEYMKNLSREEILADLSKSRAALESALGFTPRTFCVPFGAFNDTLLTALREEGFLCACNSNHGLNDSSTNCFALMRIGIRSEMSFSQFTWHISGLHERTRNLCHAIGLRTS